MFPLPEVSGIWERNLVQHRVFPSIIIERQPLICSMEKVNKGESVGLKP